MKKILGKAKYITPLLPLLMGFPTVNANVFQGAHRIEMEYQTKKFKNTDQAKDLGQNWDNDQVQSFHSNVGFDVKLWEHKIEANWFLRYSESPLFDSDSDSDRPALGYALYPLKVVNRDLFKMDYDYQGKKDRTQSVLNRFIYEWGDDEIRFKAGRMHIVYGEGFFINPINPFNHVSSLANTHGINQGNDGFKFVIQKDPALKLHIYILGDKSFTNYDEKITRTVMLRGEWKKSNRTQVIYLLGEDQKRHKYGVEGKYSFENGLIFGQMVKFSQRLDNEDPEQKGLFHYNVGVEYDILLPWTARLEVGKLDKPDISGETVVNNYLPFENFVGINNEFRFTENLKAKIGYASAPKAKFAMAKAAIEYNFQDLFSGRIFYSGPTKEADEDTEFAAHQYIPHEMGIALSAKF